MTNVKSLPAVGKSDHIVISANYITSTNFNKKLTKIYYKNFKNTDYSNLKTFAYHCIKQIKFSDYSAFHLWEIFTYLINLLIDTYVPTFNYYQLKNKKIFKQTISLIPMKQFHYKQ